MKTLVTGKSLNESKAGNPKRHSALLNCLRGHVVFYPLHFLEEGGFESSFLEWSPMFLKEIAH
jgi:hypothetical protein